ncbi:MAG: site-2 protease family protein [Candidatus Bathyarchaeia archaeon]
MSPILPFIVFLLSFWAVVYLIGRYRQLGKYGVEVKPLFINLKSDRIASVFRRVKGGKVGKVIGDIGIAIGAGLLFFACYIFISNLGQVFFRTEAVVSVVPPIPGVTIDWPQLPYFVISAAIVLISHEFAHGYMAAAEGIPVKAAGIFLAFVIPGGYIEPSEEHFKQSSLSSKLRVLSMGSTANLAVALLIIILVPALFSPTPTGVQVVRVVRDEIVGKLAENCVIYSINSSPINSVRQLSEFMSEVHPGETLVLETSRGEVILSAGSQNGRAVIGIRPRNYFPLRGGLAGEEVSIGLLATLDWAHMLSLGVGVVNMLPIYLLDGGGMLQAVADRYWPKRSRLIVIASSVFFVTLLLLSMLVGLGVLR